MRINQNLAVNFDKITALLVLKMTQHLQIRPRNQTKIKISFTVVKLVASI